MKAVKAVIIIIIIIYYYYYYYYYYYTDNFVKRNRFSKVFQHCKEE